MPAGVNSTDGSKVGTSTSLATRVWPLDSKNAKYFSRSSSVFIICQWAVVHGQLTEWELYRKQRQHGRAKIAQPDRGHGCAAVVDDPGMPPQKHRCGTKSPSS